MSEEQGKYVIEIDGEEVDAELAIGALLYELHMGGSDGKQPHKNGTPQSVHDKTPNAKKEVGTPKSAPVNQKSSTQRNSSEASDPNSQYYVEEYKNLPALIEQIKKNRIEAGTDGNDYVPEVEVGYWISPDGKIIADAHEREGYENMTGFHTPLAAKMVLGGDQRVKADPNDIDLAQIAFEEDAIEDEEVEYVMYKSGFTKVRSDVALYPDSPYLDNKSVEIHLPEGMTIGKLAIKHVLRMYDKDLIPSDRKISIFDMDNNSLRRVSPLQLEDGKLIDGGFGSFALMSASKNMTSNLFTASELHFGGPSGKEPHANGTPQSIHDKPHDGKGVEKKSTTGKSSAPQSASGSAGALQAKGLENGSAGKDVKDTDTLALQKGLLLDSEYSKKMLDKYGIDRLELLKRMEEARAKASNLGTTSQKYSVNDVYTPERQRTHQAIVDKLFEGKKASEDPTLLFSGGLPGSGKSTMLNGEQYNGFTKNAITVNADDFKGMLANSDGISDWGELAGVYHEESSYLCTLALDKAATEGYDIVYDNTMRSEKKTVDLINKFDKAGYKVKVAYAKLPLEKTVERAAIRFLETKRFVDPFAIAEYDSKPEQVMQLTKGLVDDWSVWDMDVPFGKPARLIESKQSGQG